MQYPYAPNAYVMFPSAYFHYPKKHNDGPVDIQMATSRDGIHWNRVSRRPYVPLGIEGSDEDGSLYMAIGMIRKGDELWMYYTGFDFTHGAYTPQSKNKGVIRRLVQRLDGFTSADADYEGGEFTTVPVLFDGSHLNLNLDTTAMGVARVEILDQQGRAVPGFSEKECDPILGNYINREVTWNGKGDVSSLSGKAVQLRFAMRATKLYAFQFVK